MIKIWRFGPALWASLAIAAPVIALQDALLAAPLGKAAAQEDIGTAAYRAPATIDAAFPEFPVRPHIDAKLYPECREDFAAIAAPFDRAADTVRCTGVIDEFYQTKMLPYRQAMIDYQGQLSRLYTERVGGKMHYSAERQNQFFVQMMAEHANADPDGDHQAGYRGLEARYQTDRAYLADRFCFNTGCNGYPVPAQPVPAPVPMLAAVGAVPPAIVPRETDDKRGKAPVSSDAADRCKRKKKRGGGLGGLLGSVAGQAAGLGNLGSAVTGLFGSVLVGAIACQLDEKEQKVAAEATVVLTEKEAVGATTNWTSPTREGVGGTSTITALNTEPNGSRCMSITDIAIIEGEETRISKRMCRKRPGDPYAIMV